MYRIYQQNKFSILPGTEAIKNQSFSGVSNGKVHAWENSEKKTSSRHLFYCQQENKIIRLVKSNMKNMKQTKPWSHVEYMLMVKGSQILSEINSK